MSNFKRKRPSHVTTHYCGYRKCKQDKSSDQTMNGRDRYLPTYWRIIGGRRAWRYTHKNIDPRLV